MAMLGEDARKGVRLEMGDEPGDIGRGRCCHFGKNALHVNHEQSGDHLGVAIDCPYQDYATLDLFVKEILKLNGDSETGSDLMPNDVILSRSTRPFGLVKVK